MDPSPSGSVGQPSHFFPSPTSSDDNLDDQDMGVREDKRIQTRLVIRRHQRLAALTPSSHPKKRWAAKSGKGKGVICIWPDCTANVMPTQSFKKHFVAKHLDGEETQYSRRHRNLYERAIDDPRLIDDPQHFHRFLGYRLRGLEEDNENIDKRFDALSQQLDEVLNIIGQVGEGVNKLNASQ